MDMLYYYLCSAFTWLSAAVSFGFSVKAQMRSKPLGGVALTNAKYATARSLALLVAAAGPMALVSRPYLIAMAGIMIGVQALDGVVGVKINVFKTVGPLATAVANAGLLILFLADAI